MKKRIKVVKFNKVKRTFILEFETNPLSGQGIFGIQSKSEVRNRLGFTKFYGLEPKSDDSKEASLISFDEIRLKGEKLTDKRLDLLSIRKKFEAAGLSLKRPTTSVRPGTVAQQYVDNLMKVDNMELLPISMVQEVLPLLKAETDIVSSPTGQSYRFELSDPTDIVVETLINLFRVRHEAVIFKYLNDNHPEAWFKMIFAPKAEQDSFMNK